MTQTGYDYRIMPRAWLHDEALALRAVGPQDIESIRQWRNMQMDVLRQNTIITPEAQQRYFADHVWPEKEARHPRQILLAIEQDSSLIGYGGIVHIDWHNERGEVSFLLAPPTESDNETRAALFTRFLRLLQELAFADLGLSRLWTETYAHRATHIRTLETVGFRPEGRLRGHVIIDGKPSDCLLHGRLAHEWKEQQ